MLSNLTLNNTARNDLILIGKTATLSMWALFTYGFFVFSQDVTAILTLIATLSAMMHLLLLLAVCLSPKSKYQPIIKYAAILLWGIFALGHLKPQSVTV
ncbi:hypothetical protein ACROAE_08190 [Shewanella sp. MF05960]|uniref:hypothetical protein n=1 Tax=Shewanella sp. MF05960 TaxID=3434874 RepID=UPI003D79FFF0